MMRRRWVNRRRVIVGAAVGASALLLGKKAYDFGAAPSGPKSGTFAFPDPPGEQLDGVVDPDSEPGFVFSQTAGFINDASGLNRTAVTGIVAVRSYEEVAAALRYARDRGLKVSTSGCRHTMGGQAFARGNLVLDMRGLNRIDVDKADKRITVQAGATWIDVQRRLDAVGLAVIAMQSFSGFTIGGTLSVNAHGVAHHPGPIAATVRAIRVMTSDGRIVEARPDENADLFRHAIGGYGLFGVILEAVIDVTENELYRREIAYADYRSIPDLYAEIERSGDTVALLYARFSIAAADYLQTIGVHRFLRTPGGSTPPPMQPESYTWLKRLTLNLSKTGRIGRWTRWTLERDLGPELSACVTHSAAMAEPESCMVTRNQEMFDSGAYLETRLEDADILQEYFLPPADVPRFIDGLRVAVEQSGVNLLNVTLRIVHGDAITALPYAPGDCVALVLYFNQALDRDDSERLWHVTQQLIDLAIGLGGRFYLPYQLAYSPQQLTRAYPEMPAFFAAKRRYDPIGLFSNKLYEKYGGPVG
jgi:FAD/FMN-containing dehydrogenase